jgi:CxxC motif-containing protein (DUF1111 family)
MNLSLTYRPFAYIAIASLSLFYLQPDSEASLPESLAIEVKNIIDWDTASGQTYQLQKSTSSNIWSDVGTPGQGNGQPFQHDLDTLEPGTEYRVVKTLNGNENPLAIWSAFADGAGTLVSGTNNDIFTFPSSAQSWAGFANDETSMYPLTFSNGGTITFTAYMAEEGEGSSGSGPSGPGGPGGPGGSTNPISTNSASIYFRFEKNPYPDVDPHYNTAQVVINGTTPSEYSISFPSQGNNTFSSFIFYVVDRDNPVVLQNVRVTDDSTVVGETETISVTPETVTEISWPTLDNVEYDIMESSNLVDWSDYGTNVMGNGNTQAITMTMEQASRFIRVVEPEFELFAPSDPLAQQSIIANALTLSWNPSTTPSVLGYRIYYGTDASNLDQTTDVANVNSATITGLTPETTYYFAIVAYTSDEETDPSATLFSATPAQSITLVPLHDATTTLEPVTTINDPDALITYIGDRGRARHAREDYSNGTHFRADYDTYKTFYWMGRTYYLEIIDRVGKSRWAGTDLENTITINSTTSWPLATSETRAFYLGQTTLAQYAHNDDAPDGHRAIDGTFYNTNQSKKYTSTVNFNAKLGREIRVGDNMEIEFSLFMAGLPPGSGGQTNYYATGMLYVVGEGIKPWYGIGANLDSYPLPETAWLGGKTTQHQQYSDEPTHVFKQMAGNLAPINAQTFMLGRRLHHTDFHDGAHSEPSNPVFSEHIGDGGPHFINRSCVACHTNNGRAVPNAVGDLMTKSIVRVGIDSSGTIHPELGEVLQTQATSGNTVEKTASRTAYTEITGTYGDGTAYSLRKPNYSFGGTAPDYYSVRVAPQLVGLGLLEAIDESTILNLADPTDLNNDGISGRINALNDPETGDIRLGRFGYKASKAKVSQHIASALNTDMGVTTTIYPTIDSRSDTPSLEVTDTELDQMYRYVALLALNPQRIYNKGTSTLMNGIVEGETLFNQAQCVSCHVSTMTTSEYHPLTELRNQTIRPFTDLLLHDMGEGLADNIGEHLASGSEWRTAPLWGIGLTEGVSGGESYLHDGRAQTLEEAILWHGGEAEDSKEAFRTMSASDRGKLIEFLKSL